jgi:hypothetical protein
MILFALPFAAIGTGALVMVARGWSAGSDPRQLFFLACFGIAFGLAGFGLIFAALWGGKRLDREADLRAQHPREPWLWNPEWASRRIADESGAGTVMLWVFGIFWNAIASPVLIFFPSEMEKGNHMLFFALIFPLVGIALLASAVRATLRALRFHKSTFILDTLPAPLGGTLRGRIEVPYAKLADADSIVVRLSSIERRRSGKSTTETIVWQHDEEIPRGAVARMPDRVSIPVTMPVPAELGPSTQGSERTLWRLSVDAELPGIDYLAKFEVPVFRTSESLPPQAHVPHVPPAEPREPESYVMTRTVNGRELRFPPFRAPSTALVALFIALVWTCVVVVLFMTDAPRFFGVIFGLVAMPLYFGMLELFFASWTIVLGREEVIVRRHLFGSKEHVFRRGEVAEVKVKIENETSGSTRTFYDIEVRMQDGKKIAAAKFISHKREAEWVAAQIRGAVDSRT